MQPHMENPALAGTGLPKSDQLAGSIGSEFSSPLPDIQACPRAERDFARKLARAVFGRHYATDREVLEAKKGKTIAVWKPRGVRGVGSGIRSWRAPNV